METKAVVWARWGVWAAAGICALLAAHASRAQFIAWRADPYGAAYLVPPLRPIGYFLRYSFVHFWLEYILSFVVAWVFFKAARALNARRGGMLFEPEEIYFLAIGLMVAGHPGWIFYILLVFAAYLLTSVIATLAHGVRARLSFYYFWLPCAVVTIALSAYLKQYAWYANFLI